MNIGIRGGEILDINLLNRILYSAKLNSLRNIMFSSKKWVNNSGADNLGEVSFFWNYTKRVTIVTFQITYLGSALSESSNPSITAVVDRTNTAVGYSAVGTTRTQTQNFNVNGVDFTLHIKKQEYQQTSGASKDVWVKISAFGVKDIATTEFSQIMIIQHPADTESISEELFNVKKDGDNATVKIWNGLKDYFNEDVKLTYICDVFANDATAGDYQLNLFNNFFSMEANYLDLYDMEVYSQKLNIGYKILRQYQSISITNQTMTGGINRTLYTKGNKFTLPLNVAKIQEFAQKNYRADSIFLGLSLSSFDDVFSIGTYPDDGWRSPQHVNFARKGEFNLIARTDYDSINSAHLYQLFKNYDRFQKHSFVDNIDSETELSLAPISLLVVPESLSVADTNFRFSFTLGNASEDIAIRYNLY